jgi:hypothetical protein
MVSMHRPLLETGSGSRTEAFGVREWLLLASIALILGFVVPVQSPSGWRTSCSGVIAAARVALGVAALSLVLAAHRPNGREEKGPFTQLRH